MDAHDVSFFGQKTALIVSSPSKETAHAFARFLRKKPDGSWEKPSVREGLVVKLSLLELIAARDVLTGVRREWRAFHTFKGNRTPIAVYWDEERADEGLLWFSAGEYARPLRYPETTLLKELLVHLVDEKVAHATKSGTDEKPKPRPTSSSATGFVVETPLEEDLGFEDEWEREATPVGTTRSGGWGEAPRGSLGGRKTAENSGGGGTFTSVLARASPTPSVAFSARSNAPVVRPPGSARSFGSSSAERELSSRVSARVVKASQKAVLLQLPSGKEFWTPKSMISSRFDENSTSLQEFVIASWVLRKNRVFS
ncbi:MAG: hypothetical protein Kow0069_26570 [Promethearchaeota archaeon]